MRYLVGLTTAAIVCASQAVALSCIQPDVARTFQNVAEAEESFVVLLGEFDFVVPPRQRVIIGAQPQQATATFTGQGLGARGFAKTEPKTILLQTSCAGSWCGGFPTPGTEVLSFVELTDEGYVLTLGACGGSVFDPQSAPIVEACMRGDACEGDGIFR